RSTARCPLSAPLGQHSQPPSQRCAIKAATPFGSALIVRTALYEKLKGDHPFPKSFQKQTQRGEVTL
uniref:Uncharacterized protein n=1 Tax=Gopherus evgoodei TaxID=1825980 RepID=A0A8C4VK16_9SAUR